MLTYITQTLHMFRFLTYITHCMLTWLTHTSITFLISIYVSMLTWNTQTPSCAEMFDLHFSHFLLYA